MFLECEDVTLYYEVYGEGEAIVVLHGNGEEHRYFKHQIPYLVQQGFQVIGIDMRSHGKSSDGEKPLTFELFANDVISVCDAMKIEQFHVLGFSDGANTAMCLGILYPNRIRSMIVNSGNIHPKGLCRHVRIAIYQEYYKAKLHALYDAAYRKEVERLQLMLHHPHITSKQLATLSMPVLVIAGTDDMIEAAHTRAIAYAIPHVSLTFLPQGDHFIAAKRSEEFNRIIGAFLQEVQNGR